jgi:hypothetical protein
MTDDELRIEFADRNSHGARAGAGDQTADLKILVSHRSEAD